MTAGGARTGDAPAPSAPPGGRVLAIFGPTATGKSALAHAAALALGGEIVVCDPFQRYRGLEVAADAPRPAERAEVPYHLVGDLDLTQGSSAGEHARLAQAAIDDIHTRGRVPVVAGGSGLYLRAALVALRFPPVVGASHRAEAEAAVARHPAAAHHRLARLDPDTADRVDARNPRRLARALELALAGAPRQAALWSAPPRLPTLLLGVTRPRPELDRRIAERVERELAEGLVAEIEALLARPDRHRATDQIIGVREVLALRAGEIPAGALAAALAQRTRRLARKQETWLRRLPGVTPLDLGDRPAEEALPGVMELWAAGGL